MELNILARTLAERLTREIVHAAFELAETRWDLEISEETNGMGNRVEMADDIVKCLNGEEIGCLDPDDPEDAAKISNFVNECEAVIREAIDKTLEEAEQIIEQRIKKVADEICKGEWATANHALLTHIAIPQALAAIRSLKQSNSGMEVRK